MSREILQLPSKNSVRKKTLINIARTALASGICFTMISCANDSADAFDGGKPQELTSPSAITLVAKDKNEQLSDFLDNNYARIGLAATLGMAIGMSVSAYYLGKRYDESMLRALRIAGPLAMAASASTGLIDSFVTIDRHIPSSLFLAFTFLIASQQVINTFEHYKDSKIRTAALSTAAMLSSLGVTAFIALR